MKISILSKIVVAVYMYIKQFSKKGVMLYKWNNVINLKIHETLSLLSH